MESSFSYLFKYCIFILFYCRNYVCLKQYCKYCVQCRVFNFLSNFKFITTLRGQRNEECGNLLLSKLLIKSLQVVGHPLAGATSPHPSTVLHEVDGHYSFIALVCVFLSLVSKQSFEFNVFFPFVLTLCQNIHFLSQPTKIYL